MTESKHPIAEPRLGPTIRKALIGDLDELLDLWMEMMAEHEAFDARIRMAPGARSAYRAYMSYHLSQSESYVSTAIERGVGAQCDEADRQIIGFCLAAVNRNLPMFLPPHYGYLSDIVVRKDFRRSGVGAALVDDIKGWFREKEVLSVQLQVYARNDGAEAFWQAQGFDAFYVRMWLEL